ncbi:cation channel sperm-associated auxiliary subunit delta-like [Bolinopsis microptera]|uniref:cation channel sperm-associated auxiliary subunit delta-like n=1 Tax=Bolinopsis microptera TaxID=2820187 RepID=UPI00307AADF5
MKILVTTALLLILYQPYSSAEDIVFSSQTDVFQSGVQFIGHYVGSSTEDIQWSSPDYCTQTTVTNAIETFVCSNSGEVLIELTQGAETLNFKVIVERNSICYTWGVEFSDKTVSLWVNSNTEQSDPGLSLEFYALGESPKVTLSCDKTLQELQRGQFDLETNKWVLSLGDGTDSCTHMTVTGIPVVLNGCIVADLVSPIFRKSLPEQEDSKAAESNTFKQCVDYCGSGVGVFLNNSIVLISANRMETTDILYLDHIVIDCGVMMGGTILLLVENGKELLVLEDFSLSKTIGLEFKAEHITVNTKCMSSLESNHNSSLVVLWNSANMSILYETNIVKTISSLPESMTDISAVTVSYFGIELIAKDQSDCMWFTYNYETESLASGTKLSVDCSSGCELYQVCPHTSWLEADSKLYFVTAQGKSVSPVRSYVSGEILETSVLSMAISAKDEFAILSNDGALYLGYCSRSSVIKIAEGFSSAQSLMFDSISQLYFLDDLGSLTAVPARILLEEALDSDTCSLKNFESSLSSSLLYLDKGEKKSYNISLTTTNYQKPGLLYQLYPQGHALANITSVFSASSLALGANQFTKSIHVAGLEKKGLSVIIASPEAADPQCSAKHTDVTYVVVDCPKTRHLEILDKPAQCDQYKNMSMNYTIFRTAGKPINVEYDLEELGCPIITKYDEDYLPDVWIYDNGIPTRQLCSDFTVRELNGRNDFNFTFSVNDAGCRKPPQTWFNVGENWGPDNYENCFESETKDTFTKNEGKRQYEVLNASCSNIEGKKNKIKLGKHKANYTFEVVVLDPSVSYCKLTTKFSVWIVDAPNASDLGIIVLFIACLVMIIILALSYFHYKKTILTKANMVLQS